MSDFRRGSSTVVAAFLVIFVVIAQFAETAVNVAVYVISNCAIVHITLPLFLHSISH